ncbi:hypothetical protein Moror_15625 [Moniliophthora roreri MCA 2997]|uniref:CxC2-like cysteine cluster KDZ transposase-associated domain-containing protein n=1 Tax=Moniliophthora roreri (strain MCA 2997) TaxID=1381753 RepID=V2WP85_MONRO|nr:hypothetical protein Moror_15625 [Moniliophthora roreri MCA 2997]
MEGQNFIAVLKPWCSLWQAGKITITSSRFETFDKDQPVKKSQYTHLESSSYHIHKSSLEVDALPVASPDPPPLPDFDNILDWPTSNFPPEGFGCFPASITSVEDPGKVQVKRKAKRYEDSDAPLLTWREKYRESYLDWVLGTEGRGRLYSGSCKCSSPYAQYRCIDCFGYCLTCKACILEEHVANLLHRVQEWRSDYFHTIALKTLGLLLQLSHHCEGEGCSHPKLPHWEFVVLDATGIHEVNLWFCGCNGAPEQYLQLLELGWWPSSYKELQSAATFNVLRLFHICNLQGQVTPTDFYECLEQITDGSGLTKPPDRHGQFMNMIREWRHIKSMKHFGRAHDPTGIAGTLPGGMTVLCQACSQPEINLPEGWEKATPERSWLYGLTVSVDANFKQKARAHPNDPRDPALAPGTGCCVDHDCYKALLDQQAHQDEISHCVRHELFRPNGVGDLQKGERYGNMDLILLMSVMNCVLLMLLISYDIACQWFKHFYARMRALPSDLHIPDFTNIQFKVPKFHLPVHVPSCYAPFSFNFTKGIGKVDGEGIERQWSLLNPISCSLSMMTAGGRFDTLDNFCNYLNWKKTISLASSLLKKLIKAIPEAIINTCAFSILDEGLRARYGSKVDEWEYQVSKWEQDHKKLCPYDRPEQGKF